MKQFLATTVAVVLFFIPCSHLLAQVKTWQVYEIELTASATHDWDSWPVSVTFTGTSGSAAGTSLTVKGFWDGGNTWKVRFAPPYSGTWTYNSSSTDTGLNGQIGTLTVTDWTEAEKQQNPTRRGMLQVFSDNPHFFSYADGTPFFWAADSWWMWGRDGISFSSWQNLVDTRVAQGFNLGQMYVGGEYLLNATYPWGDKFLVSNSPPVVDIVRFQAFDSFIPYANSKGVSIWLTSFWSNPGWPEGDYFDTDFAKNFYRYILARYGAYNVLFIICGEHYPDHIDEYWDEVGQMLDTEDPYHHLISIHDQPDEDPTYATLDGKAWMKFHQHQHGHGLELENLISQVSGGWAVNKPYVTTEINYQFLNKDFQEIEIRTGAWVAVLSGAAGHTYGAGGTWEAYVPEIDHYDSGYDTDPYDEALAYLGGAQFGYFAQFFRSISFWTLVPHQDLISGNSNAYCAANEGREYVIYLSQGGSVDVDLSAAPSGLPVEWLNPRTGAKTSATSVNGGGTRSFAAPDNNDWVLHIGVSEETSLPVTIAEFNGYLSNKAVKLNWKTASEQDNQGFVLFRNGKQLASYRTNGQLIGRGTTSNESLYGYTDWTIEPDKEYSYTLRSVDLNGQAHDYPEAVVIRPYENKLEQNHPNPFNPVTTIRFSLKKAGLAKLVVYDVLGRAVHSKSLDGKAGWNEVRFDGAKLASGIYFYRLVAGNFAKTMKMLLMK